MSDSMVMMRGDRSAPARSQPWASLTHPRGAHKARSPCAAHFLVSARSRFIMSGSDDFCALLRTQSGTEFFGSAWTV